MALQILTVHRTKAKTALLRKILGLSRQTAIRRIKATTAAMQSIDHAKPPLLKRKHNRIPDQQRQQILQIAGHEENADLSPRQIYAKLLDSRVYLCHWRTLYRILHEAGQMTKRNLTRRHPKHNKPVLTATAPKQVLCYDITRVPGPRKGSWFFLYVVYDLFSRCIVGWTVQETESGFRVRRLLLETLLRLGLRDLPAGSVTIHSDRGAPMKSRPVMDLLEQLGVKASFSRPRVSNDNPHAESGFKTLKYNHRFPRRFDNIAAAREFLAKHIGWYNTEHRHVNLKLFTPMQVFTGEFTKLAQIRQQALDEAYAKNPQRFVHGSPKIKLPPQVVHLNPVGKEMENLTA